MHTSSLSSETTSPASLRLALCWSFTRRASACSNETGDIREIDAVVGEKRRPACARAASAHLYAPSPSSSRSSAPPQPRSGQPPWHTPLGRTHCICRASLEVRGETKSRRQETNKSAEVEATVEINACCGRCQRSEHIVLQANKRLGDRGQRAAGTVPSQFMSKSCTFSSAAMSRPVNFAPFWRGRSTQSFTLCVSAPQLRRQQQKGKAPVHQGAGGPEQVRRIVKQHARRRRPQGRSSAGSQVDRNDGRQRA